ncbi:hypothetical protein [Alloactinosynnema sp. L-07]|uniref:helix-turn-helix transcriptional regulator n=1 Tax=Alloactinosynnema sp. L-07 TaxID=1653480 RepID=UPI00065F0807|nr:helix-turn-helix transcriptional regulator [Alloactinosynnema sp. L-07]CRK56893.1 hypothetical protein [Alloactinosynnema sp. L-07]
MTTTTHHEIHEPADAAWPLNAYLREARLRAGMSIKQTARAAGLRVRDVECLETRPAALRSRVEAVVAALGADVDHALALVGLTPEVIADAEQRFGGSAPGCDRPPTRGERSPTAEQD